MKNQPDFQSQRTELQILAQQYSMDVVYGPKYHAELNPIELVWNVMKHHTRANLTKGLESLKAHLYENPKAAATLVTPDLIKKCMEHVHYVIRAYRELNWKASREKVGHNRSHCFRTVAAVKKADKEKQFYGQREAVLLMKRLDREKEIEEEGAEQLYGAN